MNIIKWVGHIAVYENGTGVIKDDDKHIHIEPTHIVNILINKNCFFRFETDIFKLWFDAQCYVTTHYYTRAYWSHKSFIVRKGAHYCIMNV